MEGIGNDKGNLKLIDSEGGDTATDTGKVVIVVGEVYHLRNGYMVRILGKTKEGKFIANMIDCEGKSLSLGGQIYLANGKLPDYTESIYDIVRHGTEGEWDSMGREMSFWDKIWRRGKRRGRRQ